MRLIVSGLFVGIKPNRRCDMCRVKPSAHPRDRDHRSLKLKSQSTLVSTLNLKKSESVPYVNVYTVFEFEYYQMHRRYVG
jgi:hypothetical protein